MADSIQVQIEKLRTSISTLEAQRSLLGDAIVDPVLALSRQKLALLEQQAAEPSEEHQGQAGTPAEERRMVTILFMDMVGSTSMAEKLDPEEWRQVVTKLHTALGEAITAHHGSIAQYLGDGLLAFFGSKEATEHDPENAIRAALDGQAAVTGLLSVEKVQVRAGIHTGLVVVGELGEATHKEFTASGDAMNLAERLQSAAPPGGILISHETYRYVRGVFDVTPRPPLTVKGKSETIQTYLVRRAKPRPFRSVARGVAGIEVRTIGREAETQALQDAYLRAYEGHGVVWAQLLGDPGVGKSRMLEDMNDWLDLRQETFRILRARAFPDDANQPFALVRRMWFDRFQIAEDTQLEQAEKKWVERFKELSGLEDYEEPAHALGLLVGLSFAGSPHIGAMRNDPAQVKGRALVVSRELVKEVRQESPVVVLLEDLQWMDAPSWEYLMEAFLGGEAGEQPNGLFILGAARPDWCPPQELSELFKASLPNVIARSSLPRAERRVLGNARTCTSTGASAGEAIPSQGEIASGWKNTSPRNDSIDREKWGAIISLAPLTDQATHQLAMEIFQRVVDVPEQVIDMIVERSEGVPYYTEEIVNWFVDRGILDTRSEQWRFFPEKLKEQPLPATLQHLLLTRLSGLSQPERAALQRGAIFGRRFWTGGLEALGVQNGAEMLGELQPRGFVEVQPESAFQGDTEWSFQQNLLQEVTYESVLKRERAALHKLAAGWLERQARQAGRLDEFAGVLGEHCERAGELSVAADWYLRAGKCAMGQGAPREARVFFTRSIELLPPVDRERRWQALLGRMEALSVLGDDESRRVDITAKLDLARSFNDANYLAEAYLSQAGFGLLSGDMHVAEQASREALAAARSCGNEAIEAKTLALIANIGVRWGDKLASIPNIEEALKLSRRLGDESLLATVLIQAANLYTYLGDITRAIQLELEQIELEHRLGNRSQEAVGLGNMGYYYIYVGMYKEARSLLEQSRTINEALGARSILAFNLMNLGNVYLDTGDLRKARQLNEQALQEISPSRDVSGKTYALTNLGHVQLAMGDVSGAARYFSEAYEIALSHELADPACEATTGLAACALMQGQLDEARKYVHEAWDHLKEHFLEGLNNPGRVYHTCAETFDALGEDENAQAVIESGHQALMDMAEKINVPEWRQSFLENVPDNRAIMEMWERGKA